MCYNALVSHEKRGKVVFRLSNQYGECDVEVNSMHIAKQSTDALADGKGLGKAKVDMSTIIAFTDKAVTVSSQSSFVIPKGEVTLTDPVDLNVEGLENNDIGKIQDTSKYNQQIPSLTESLISTKQ